MTDTTNAPTEEQVKAANDAELAKWEGDFDPKSLEVPYSNDEVEEEVKDDTKDDVKDDKGGDDTPPVEDDDTEELEEIYDDPAPVVTVDDPGEFTPKDYSFEVTLDGKTTKITSPEQATKFADENADEFAAKDLLSFMRNANKMEAGLEKDKETWEAQKDKYEEQKDTEARQNEIVLNMANEMEYLADKGFIPKVADEFKDADWQDPHVARQPGVKEQRELVSYMTKENARREKNGVQPISSVIDAYNAWQLDSERKAETAAEKKAGEARKTAGARVASTTSSSVEGFVPKGIAVGNPNVFRRSSSIWD